MSVISLHSTAYSVTHRLLNDAVSATQVIHNRIRYKDYHEIRAGHVW
jgi:hypothetical protein